MIIETIEISGINYENHLPNEGFVFVRKSDNEKFTGIVLGENETINDYDEKLIEYEKNI